MIGAALGGAMEPFRFGAATEPLFGVHHRPTGGTAQTAGVVLPTARPRARGLPFGYRHLAVHLAAAGFHVLRFDFFTCGDSAGVGVITDPPAPDLGGTPPAVILLNAGVVHRVGPNRLHVKMAGGRQLRATWSCASTSWASATARSGATRSRLREARPWRCGKPWTAGRAP